MAAILSEIERDAALVDLPGWRYDAERAALAKSFRFRDFADAFGFMTKVFRHAERVDHHPDWAQSWNQVDIHLTTHVAGGVTGRDVALAKAIDAIA